MKVRYWRVGMSRTKMRAVPDGVVFLEHQGNQEEAPPSNSLYFAADPPQPEANPATLKLIPYYSWVNRERSEMRVWIPYIRAWKTDQLARGICENGTCESRERVEYLRTIARATILSVAADHRAEPPVLCSSSIQFGAISGQCLRRGAIAAQPAIRSG